MVLVKLGDESDGKLAERLKRRRPDGRSHWIKILVDELLRKPIALKELVDSFIAGLGREDLGSQLVEPQQVPQQAEKARVEEVAALRKQAIEVGASILKPCPLTRNT